MTLPPNQKCPRCGRWSRMYNVRDCSTCKRDGKARARDTAAELRARRSSAGRRELPPTTLADTFDPELYNRIHERWLARQPADHPWKVSAPGSSSSSPAPPQLSLDFASSVATSGG